MTCKEIYDMVAKHTDNDVSIFICAENWANTEGGTLIAENVDANLFCHLCGDKIPTDWALCCSDEGSKIDLGFLF